MQGRLSDLAGILRGLYRILDSSVKLRSKKATLLPDDSDFLSFLSSIVRDSVNNIPRFHPDNLSYVLGRINLISKQNQIVLDQLVSSKFKPSCSLCQCNLHSPSSIGDQGIDPSTPKFRRISKGFVPSSPVPSERPLNLIQSDIKRNISSTVPPFPLDKSISANAGSGGTKKIVASKERRVPSSRVGRLAGFGNLAVGLGLSAAAQWTKKQVGLAGESSSGNSNPLLTEANLERIVDTLCRMRGAALKLGQMLSIQDDSVVSPQLQRIFERVRQAADFMPVKQMRRVMASELGPDWSSLLAEFDEKPFAAASIGQVHRGVLHDSKVVAIKVQYPGVADSIDADITNLMSLLNRFNILPRGLFAERAVKVAKRELKAECDYLREASYCKRFATLLSDDPVFQVPAVVDSLTTQRVFTAEYMNGLVLDECISLPQPIRNWIGEQLLRLCLREVFVFRTMQTDPNWSNFLYNPESGKIVLLDFGASREYNKNFVDLYLRLINAAANGNRADIVKFSHHLGFLTGYETKVMVDAHCDAVSILGEAFACTKPFDFGHQSTTKQINELIPVMLAHRLTPPPDETYSLHRKMSGCFLLCGKLKSVINCRPLFQKIYNNYKFEKLPETQKP